MERDSGYVLWSRWRCHPCSTQHKCLDELTYNGKSGMDLLTMCTAMDDSFTILEKAKEAVPETKKVRYLQDAITAPHLENAKTSINGCEVKMNSFKASKNFVLMNNRAHQLAKKGRKVAAIRTANGRDGKKGGRGHKRKAEGGQHKKPEGFDPNTRVPNKDYSKWSADEKTRWMNIKKDAGVATRQVGMVSCTPKELETMVNEAVERKVAAAVAAEVKEDEPAETKTKKNAGALQ